MKPIGGFTASKGLDATEKKKGSIIDTQEVHPKISQSLHHTEVVFCVDVKVRNGAFLEISILLENDCRIAGLPFRIFPICASFQKGGKVWSY